MSLLFWETQEAKKVKHMENDVLFYTLSDIKQENLSILYHIGYNSNDYYYFCIRKDIKNEENTIDRDCEAIKERIRADARGVGAQVRRRA
jgi:hypothetical protein